MKRLFALILCFCMFSVTVNATSVQLTMGETTVKSYDLDRRSIETETVEAAPFTIDDRTMVPVRAITEAFDNSIFIFHNGYRSV